MYIANTKKGFSLVEMLIYIAMIITLATIVTTTLLSLSGTFYSVRVSRDIEASAVSSLERIVREIRDSETVLTAESVLGTNPGVLTVSRTLPDLSTEKVKFYLSNGILVVSVNGLDEGSLTSNSISVDSLVFTLISNTETEGVRVEMVLSGSKGPAEITKKFELFAVLRNSY